MLQAAKEIKKKNVEKFYDDEIQKSMQISWHSNSKLNALILLIENGISANKLIQMNPTIAIQLIEAITERSSACLVI